MVNCISEGIFMVPSLINAYIEKSRTNRETHCRFDICGHHGIDIVGCQRHFVDIQGMGEHWQQKKRESRGA